jgi:hypothetical protein
MPHHQQSQEHAPSTARFTYGHLTALELPLLHCMHKSVQAAAHVSHQKHKQARASLGAFPLPVRPRVRTRPADVAMNLRVRHCTQLSLSPCRFLQPLPAEPLQTAAYPPSPRTLPVSRQVPSTCQSNPSQSQAPVVVPAPLRHGPRLFPSPLSLSRRAFLPHRFDPPQRPVTSPDPSPQACPKSTALVQRGVPAC